MPHFSRAILNAVTKAKVQRESIQEIDGSVGYMSNIQKSSVDGQESVDGQCLVPTTIDLKSFLEIDQPTCVPHPTMCHDFIGNTSICCQKLYRKQGEKSYYDFICSLKDANDNTIVEITFNPTIANVECSPKDYFLELVKEEKKLFRLKSENCKFDSDNLLNRTCANANINDKAKNEGKTIEIEIKKECERKIISGTLKDVSIGNSDLLIYLVKMVINGEKSFGSKDIRIGLDCNRMNAGHASMVDSDTNEFLYYAIIFPKTIYSNIFFLDMCTGHEFTHNKQALFNLPADEIEANTLGILYMFIRGVKFYLKDEIFCNPFILSFRDIGPHLTEQDIETYGYNTRSDHHDQNYENAVMINTLSQGAAMLTFFKKQIEQDKKYLK